MGHLNLMDPRAKETHMRSAQERSTKMHLGIVPSLVMRSLAMIMAVALAIFSSPLLLLGEQGIAEAAQSSEETGEPIAARSQNQVADVGMSEVELIADEGAGSSHEGAVESRIGEGAADPYGAEREDRANSWRYADGQPVPDEDGVDLLRSRAAGGTYSWYKDGNTWRTVDAVGRSPFAVSDAMAFGIDVSEHQGWIDWAQVKQSGAGFAIIRCGYGMDYRSQDDDYWLENVQGCINSGIPFGVYLYSYADSEYRASSEADHVLRCLSEAGLNPTKVSFPVFYDLEESSLADAGNRSLLASMASIFCGKISQAGYEPGVYANQNWWQNYLTDDAFDQWERWVAQYPYNGSTGSTYAGYHSMWQCMSKGNIPGISTNVDIDFAYEPYEAPNPKGNSMYRLYNPNSGEHFYTVSRAERNSLRLAGWKYEGVGWTAPFSSNSPVYRLYSGTDHHYTMSAHERDSLVRAGWSYEGVGWYSDDAKGIPLYRQFNPWVNPHASYNNSGSHNYTVNRHEHNSLVQLGWHDEGIGWYGCS